MANALLMSALQCLLNLTVTICVNLSTYARIVALHSTCNSIAPFVFQRKKILDEFNVTQENAVQNSSIDPNRSSPILSARVYIYASRLLAWRDSIKCKRLNL